MAVGMTTNRTSAAPQVVANGVVRPMGLESAPAPIAADLAEVERRLAAELHGRTPYVHRLTEHLQHYRGKRLRPMLLLLTAKACGRVAPEHHTLAAVVEMIHTATLVHDDVLDQADLRRHVPTVNAKWGNASSVLLGDMLFSHAFYLASTTGSTLACRVIGQATNRVCQGELQQIGESGNLDLTEADYFDIIDGKTAELTACACRLGALFAQVSEATVERLAAYGRDLGLAFQIADDVLDLVGSEHEAGKSLGTDVAQRKLTLPLIHLLQQGPPHLARALRSHLASATPDARLAIRHLLEESGSIQYALDRAEGHAAKAREALQVLPTSEARLLLEGLTSQVIHRNR